MRRIAGGAALVGVGVLVAEAFTSRPFRARLMAGCERLFEQMPDDFPPKRMMRDIEEIRASNARTLQLLVIPALLASEAPRKCQTGNPQQTIRWVRTKILAGRLEKGRTTSREEET